MFIVQAGNTKGGSIIVPLTSCLTGLDKSVFQIKIKIVNCHTADSKPVKKGDQWDSDTSPFSIPWFRPLILSSRVRIQPPGENCEREKKELFAEKEKKNGLAYQSNFLASF
jgi:hypothetical protein